MELLDGAQSSDYRKVNSASPQGYNCLMAIIPITTFPYYCFKDYGSRGGEAGIQEKNIYICCFFSMEDAEVANLEPKAIGKL